MRLETDCPVYFSQEQLDWLAEQGHEVKNTLELSKEQWEWIVDHHIDPRTVIAITNEDADAPDKPGKRNGDEVAPRSDTPHVMVTVLENRNGSKHQRPRRLAVKCTRPFPE